MLIDHLDFQTLIQITLNVILENPFFFIIDLRKYIKFPHSHLHLH